MRFGKLRAKLDRLIQPRDCLGEFSAVHQCFAEQHESLRRRISPHRPFEGIDRFTRAPQRRQRLVQRGQHHRRRLRIERHRPPQMFDRLLVHAPGRHDRAEIDAEQIGRWPKRDRPLDQLLRFLRFAFLIDEQAHEMQRIRFVGMKREGENLRVEPLGFVQPAGLMVRHRFVEYAPDCHDCWCMGWCGGRQQNHFQEASNRHLLRVVQVTRGPGFQSHIEESGRLRGTSANPASNTRRRKIGSFFPYPRPLQGVKSSAYTTGL